MYVMQVIEVLVSCLTVSSRHALDCVFTHPMGYHDSQEAPYRRAELLPFEPVSEMCVGTRMGLWSCLAIYNPHG